MLVAYVTSSFPESGGRSFILQTFTLHQVCAGPGCSLGSGPWARGGRLTFPGASSHRSAGRGLREAFSGLRAHPSLFLPLSFLHPSSSPRREGGGLTPALSWAPAPRGRCGGGGRRAGRAGVYAGCLARSALP